jgi:hypothetical protein
VRMRISSESPIMLQMVVPCQPEESCCLSSESPIMQMVVPCQPEKILLLGLGKKESSVSSSKSRSPKIHVPAREKVFKILEVRRVWILVSLLHQIYLNPSFVLDIYFCNDIFAVK